IEKTHNTARVFTEQRHISWVLLVAVVLWGVYGYLNMPKRKDPEVPVRLAVALTPWPGVSAEKVRGPRHAPARNESGRQREGEEDRVDLPHRPGAGSDVRTITGNGFPHLTLR
ncbi:MAG TPA: hypothetical protein VF911_11720, partial [Thermoanaerobaculia bacterium]